MNKLDQIKLLTYRTVCLGKHLLVFSSPVATKQRQEVAPLDNIGRLFEVPVDVLLDSGLLISVVLASSLPLESIVNVALHSGSDLKIRFLRSGKAANLTED